jgi:hypothetical protein
MESLSYENHVRPGSILRHAGRVWGIVSHCYDHYDDYGKIISDQEGTKSEAWQGSGVSIEKIDFPTP